jgi:ribonuclease BN (tRNA processing enzyme)
VGEQAFEVRCFGTADGSACSDRNHSSFLYRFGDQTVLIDCGDGLDRTYNAAGLEPDLVDVVILSHMHSDHVGGLFMFIQSLWLQRRRKPLRVHVPAGAVKPVKTMLNTALLFDELLPFKLSLCPLKPRNAMAMSGVRIIPFPTSHLNGLRAQFGGKHKVDFSAYCFLLQSRKARRPAGSVRMGHSADLGKPEDLDPLFREPLDLLVCELSHFTPEELFLYLRHRPVKRVALVHLAEKYRNALSDTRRLARTIIPGIPLRFPNDGDEIRL